MGSGKLLVPEAAAIASATADQIEGIPLFLIPKVIAEQIRKKRESVFLITVKRNFMHRYTVIVETHDEHDRRVNPKVPEKSVREGYDRDGEKKTTRVQGR